MNRAQPCENSDAITALVVDTADKKLSTDQPSVNLVTCHAFFVTRSIVSYNNTAHTTKRDLMRNAKNRITRN